MTQANWGKKKNFECYQSESNLRPSSGYFRRASTKPSEKLSRVTRTVYDDKLSAYYEDRNVTMVM